MAESEKELKSLLIKVEEDSEKVGLKLSIQKTKIMASGPIASWKIDGETVETVSDFIFLGSKTTADGDCSHEIKRCLLLGRKVMTNLDSIFKSRDITLLFTGGQGQIIFPGAEQRHFSLQSSRGAESSRQASKYDYDNKSNEKQVKETVPT